MNLLPELDLFGKIVEKTLTKKERRKIERANNLKLGQPNYFFPSNHTANVWHTDGYTLGKNGTTKEGGFTIFRNGEFYRTQRIVNAQNIFTNNEAELFGVMNALKDCDFGDEIITDSMNTLSWVRGGKSKARPDLNEFCKLCKDRLNEKQVNLYWEGRDENLAGHYNEETFNA